MKTDDNTALATTFYGRVSAGDAAGAAALVSEDYVGHGMGAGGGRDSVRQDVQTWQEAVGDLRIEVHDVVAQDDRVVVRMTLRGTQTGAFAGIPPSGRQFEIGGTDVLRIRDGEIVEAWTLCDLASMFIQLGALPAPA